MVNTLQNGALNNYVTIQKESLFKKPIIYIIRVCNVAAASDPQANYPQQPPVPAGPPINPPDYDLGDYNPTTSPPMPTMPPDDQGGVDDPNQQPSRIEFNRVNNLSPDQQQLLQDTILSSLQSMQSDGPRIKLVTFLRPFSIMPIASQAFIRLGSFSGARNDNFRGRIANEQLNRNIGRANMRQGRFIDSKARSLHRNRINHNKRVAQRQVLDKISRPRTNV